ncbi:chromatin accessibility complex subunit 1 [Phyllostomus discolor]|uniref:Chromatin accessibility complex subunit 1 n=1 Tax=Phyllostomus discolor TaxID=89673 RepID=A0A833ZWI6_9CHIR|nr:chromatin accessibility complex subunit 1 [Phyllostomus discolor]
MLPQRVGLERRGVGSLRFLACFVPGPGFLRVREKNCRSARDVGVRACVGTVSAASIRELNKELFVQHLATCSYRHGGGKEKKALTYNDLSNTAEESETFQFLADILPKKILASKYLKMLKEKRDEDEEEENVNSDDSDDDEAES